MKGLQLTEFEERFGSQRAVAYPNEPLVELMMERKLEGDTEAVVEPAELRLPDGGVQVGTGKQPWFALRVKPNYEKPVSVALRGKGFEEFLPLFRSRRQWCRRR